MATIGNTAVTLADWANTRDTNGKTADIVEMLSQKNEILNDMLWREGNLPTGHKTTVRIGMPSSTFRMFNQGTAPSKSQSAPITFSVSMVEQRGQVDKKIADLEADAAAYRLSENSAHIEQMGQDVASNLFYGNEALDPERFTGFARYYNTMVTANAASADNVVGMGSTGTDLNSIFFVNWSDQGIFGIYPKGSQAGLVHEDLGVDDAFDANGGRYRAYLDLFQWDCGLAVRDWREAGRVCNIKTATLRDTTSIGTDYLKLLVRNCIVASERINGSGKVLYMNRVTKTALRLGILEKVIGNFTFETVAGKEVMMFDGMPVRTVDALLSTESTII